MGNLSQGYGSGGDSMLANAPGLDWQQKQASGNLMNPQPEGVMRVQSSSGGIEDLKYWLKYESNKKYEESLVKLQLDSQKI
mmetsp:Transcript_4778/g.8195  ORF Transcript_4778/g.8195 Transcript_4778/m.8195 type:complete len:81 (+) Transcript_4778:502-744(+)